MTANLPPTLSEGKSSDEITAPPATPP